MEENTNVQKEESTKSSHNIPKWYSRLAAHFIDSLLLGVVGGLIILPISFLVGIISPTGALTFGVVVSSIVGLAICTLYYAYFHSKDGQTPGMKFIGLKIAKNNGELLSFSNALLRSMIFFAPIILVNMFTNFTPVTLAPFIISITGIYPAIIAITILLDKKNNQGFHDKVFGAVNTSLNENIKRAKVTTSTCLGCLGLFIVSMIVLLIFLGILSGVVDTVRGNMPKTNSQNQLMNQGTKNPSMNGEEIDVSKIFYDTCMKESKGSGYNYSSYCSCVANEMKNTQNVNEINENCKDKIISK